MPITARSITPGQYRLAQAVLSGRVTRASMPKSIAREIVDKTPESKRRQFMAQENPSIWKKLRSKASRTKDSWIVYQTVATELEAQKVAGRLEAAGVNHVKIEKKSAGFFSRKKPTWQIKVLREGVRKITRAEEARKLGKGKVSQEEKRERARIARERQQKDRDERREKEKVRQEERRDKREREKEERKEKQAQDREERKEKMREDRERKRRMKKRVSKYKGVRIIERDGQFSAPSIDNSTFDSKKDAQEFITYYKSGMRSNPKRRNPSGEAAESYEKFHGAPSTEVITITEKLHVHEHLTSLGRLEGLKIRAVNGKDYTIEFRKAMLAANEALTQLFVEGGDQSLALGRFGIDPKGRESVVVGKVWAIGYVTAKSFDDMKPSLYVHQMGPEEANTKPDGDLWDDARPPKEWVFSTDDLPILRYDVRNKKVYLDGGTYSIDKPLIGVSDGIIG